MFNSAKIEKLTNELSAALARAEAAESEIAKLKASIAETAGIAAKAAEDDEKPMDEEVEGEEDDKEEDMESEEDAAKALVTIRASVSTLAAKVTALETANAALDKSIEAKVSATLAAMGIDPISRAEGVADGTKDREASSTVKGVKRVAAASKVKN